MACTVIKEWLLEILFGTGGSWICLLFSGSSDCTSNDQGMLEQILVDLEEKHQVSAVSVM